MQFNKRLRFKRYSLISTLEASATCWIRLYEYSGWGFCVDSGVIRFAPGRNTCVNTAIIGEQHFSDSLSRSDFFFARDKA